MSDPITVVSHASLGDRLKSSCAGIVLGIIFFLGSFPLLFWNEQRAVARYDALREGEALTIPLSNASVIDPANDGKLVHFTASVYRGNSASSLTDPIFGISCSDCLALQRHSEMYQWKENSSTKAKTNVGGSTTTTTTYTYDTTWSSFTIYSGNFQDKSSQYWNPTSFDYPSNDIIGDPIMAGAFELPSNIQSWVLNDDVPKNVAVTDIVDTALRTKVVSESKTPATGYFIGTGTSSSPQVGDERVWFTETLPTEITVVGVQKGDTVTAFVSESGKGGNVLLYTHGKVSAPELFDIAESQNEILTWVIRFVGFAIMALGQIFIWSPLKVASDIIPCVGSLVGCGINFISITIAAVLSSLTISIAWLIAHPKIGAIVLGVCLVVIGLCAFVFKMLLGRNKSDEEEEMEQAVEKTDDDVEAGKNDLNDIKEYKPE